MKKENDYDAEIHIIHIKTSFEFIKLSHLFWANRHSSN